MIKRTFEERMAFTGGAEDTPTVSVGKFVCFGSLNDGEKNLRIAQLGQIVQLSLETMKAIIDWAEKEDS